MKKISLLLIIFVVMFTGFKKNVSQDIEQLDLNSKKNNKQANNNSIKIAFFIAEPHIYLDEKKEKLTGAVYELLEKYIGPEMGIKFIWDKEPTNVPRQLIILETNNNYAAAVLIPTPDRQKKYNFSEKPYFLSQTAIAILKTNKLKKISKIDDILGMTIGYADQTFISPFMRDKRIKFDLITDPKYQEINYQKLLKNRIDAVYLPDKAALLALAKSMKIENKVRIINLPEKPSPFHVVFTKGAEDIAEKYNKAFDKLNAQTLYIKLLKQYLDVSQL